MSAVPAVAATVFVAAAGTLPALCPFRLWSGQACPLCGMTRALGELATGDLGTAIRFHPLVLLVVVQLAVVGFLSTGTTSRPSAKVMSLAAAANGIVFVLVWLVRWRLDLLGFVVD